MGKRWGIFAGVSAFGLCLALAPLDGGISAFASWSAFHAAWGTGTVVATEAVTAGKVGLGVGRVVNGVINKNKKKAKDGAKKVWGEANGVCAEQTGYGILHWAWEGIGTLFGMC